MRFYAVLLAAVAAFALVCPCLGRGWAAGRETHVPRGMKATVTAQEKDLARMRAYKVVAEEMGGNPDELAMLARVEEVTDELLREKFPDAYEKKRRSSDSDDVWENGTVVRYIARVLLFVLAVCGLMAWRDPIKADKPDSTKFIRGGPAGTAAHTRKTK